MGHRDPPHRPGFKFPAKMLELLSDLRLALLATAPAGHARSTAAEQVQGSGKLILATPYRLTNLLKPQT
jgi:hypothetical protein